MANPTILIPSKWTPIRTILSRLKGMEDKGRPKGRAIGGYIAGDLAELKKMIILCPLCKHGFDWKKHHYYNITFYDQVRARGKCDICREERNDLHMYLHESLLGQSWTPRGKSFGKPNPATYITRKGVRHG